jgi:hypothetical protein
MGLGSDRSWFQSGLAGEQFALEPDRARFQRGALGVGERRQQLGIELEQRRGDQILAQRRDQQRHRDQQQEGGGDQYGGLLCAKQPAADQERSGDRSPDCQTQTVIGGECAAQQQSEERREIVDGDAHDALRRAVCSAWDVNALRSGRPAAPYAEVWIDGSADVNVPECVGMPE